MNEKKTVALGNTHQPVVISGQRTFRPQGSGQVPVNVPPLQSGVTPTVPAAPVIPVQTPVKPVSGNNSQSGTAKQGGN